MSETPANAFEAMREPLRRLDALVGVARKAHHETGQIPPALLEEFHEARNALEKAFVRQFEALDKPNQAAMRAFLRQTRDLTLAQMAMHLEKLVRLSRDLINQLVIQGAPTASLEDDMADRPMPQTRAARRRVWLGVVALVTALALGGVGVAWQGGAFEPAGPPPAPNVPPQPQPPVVIAPDQPEPEPPFNARAAGYPERFTPAEIAALDLLEDGPESLLPGHLLPALLALEDLVHPLQPDRLRTTPQDTRTALREFAALALADVPAWQEQRKPLLDAFIAFTQRRLNLVLYDSRSPSVLLSDVLYTKGGSQRSLCAAYVALAQAMGAPVGLYAPHGPEFPVAGAFMPDGLHTFNGEDFGLRGTSVPSARTADIIAAMAEDLLPTLNEPAAKLLCIALVQQLGTLRPELAVQGLAWVDTAWFATGTEPTRARLARKLAPAICDTWLGRGDSVEATDALALYRLAQAAGLAEREKAAVLLLARRADAGALLEGEPLALRVGDLMAERGELTPAIEWYRRALASHPDDPRPALRLAAHVPAEHAAMLREAYARGERSTAFLLALATVLAADQPLAALAILDELCTLDPREKHIEAAALTCLSLERPDWAQDRIGQYREFASTPVLQRLDLICELQRHGLNDRARALARAWRERGEKDPFMEGLLARYGG